MYRELLNEVADNRVKYGERAQEPCPPERIESLRAEVRSRLGTDLPGDYLAFLGDQDGLNWNGLFIYGSRTARVSGSDDAQIEGIVEANLGWRDDEYFLDYLVFGEGNMDLYVRHLPTGEYRVIDRVPGNVIETHPTFEALLAAALKAHL